MSKPDTPVSVLRRKFFLSDSTEDDNSSTPQTPTKSPQGVFTETKGGSVGSTPPPVSPKKWIVRQGSGGFDSGNGPEEIVKPDTPVSVLRRKFFLSESTEDDNSSTPQTPTKSPQGVFTETKGGSVGSTPPPVSPKKWIVRQGSGGFDSGNGPEEIVKPDTPVSVLRRKFFLSDSTEDDNSSTPQTPTKSPQGGSVGSTPPPVSPKKWIVRQGSGGFDSGNGPEEIVKDAISLSNWQNGLKPWTYLWKDLKRRGEKETKIVKVEAEQLNEAIKRYILLLSKHGDDLKWHTAELLCIADNLDKVSKGTKIAGITGGATTAAGGVAAAAGVILAPVTMGLSLALTAVGVGVAAAGGITGASAAIANKAHVSQSKKKLEKTFQEYKDLMVNIQDCLKFINEGLEQLKQHDLYVLSEARKDSVKIAKMVQLAATGRASARAIEANSNASGLIEGFALGMDLVIQGKNGQRPKKDFKSALGKKIRKLAEELNKGLDELKDLFSEHCSEV
ncbi:uncharacterized protein LOC116042923 isoform X2 [Sander lucioperca]|uniref:uncharacterized protein LOC116042923 isoform X2 n=1 Tax=Sander lucioperca TaxID=283035 RepID=UPI001653EC26|nr:uncharacterized protein LOC116042923 isoform X2 [Sander lucioperca]